MAAFYVEVQCVVGTLDCMPKSSEQVRIPKSLTDSARIIAAAFGETLPAYITRLVREGVKRDYPKATKKIVEKGENPLDE